MSNFDLKIVPVRDNVLLLAESEFGEAFFIEKKNFFLEMIESSQKLRRAYSAYLRYGDEIKIEDQVHPFGEKLFAGVFRERILDLFNRTIGGSSDGQLNIRLLLSDPLFNTIHWEVMRFRHEYIGFRHNLIRHPFVLRPVRIPDSVRKKLHVLVIAVDVFNDASTIVDEHSTLINLLKGFGDQIRLSTLYQKEATVDNVMDLLFEGVDIWHFTGHGLYNPENPLESSLIVWGDKKDEFGKISIRSLKALATSQSLGFCFLNACNTGRTAEVEKKLQNSGSGEYFVSMAHSLIEAGVPIVVATNHEITVRAATLLSKRFYNGIVKFGKRVDQAIRDARAELYIGGEFIIPSDWSCPVLYSRSRYLQLGTEQLQWEASFDIYRLRNIEKPSYISTLVPEEFTR